MSGIPSWARPGVKVVCVDDSCGPKEEWLPGEAPEKGQIYTIERAFSYSNDRVVLWLREIQRHPNVVIRWGDNGYFIHRFRPLTEVSETDETEAELYHKKHLHARRSERERA